MIFSLTTDNKQITDCNCKNYETMNLLKIENQASGNYRIDVYKRCHALQLIRKNNLTKEWIVDLKWLFMSFKFLTKKMRLCVKITFLPDGQQKHLGTQCIRSCYTHNEQRLKTI